jgi:AAA15 family ATPase/GTPase
MLILFTIGNYCSFGELQTINFSAYKHDKQLFENITKTDVVDCLSSSLICGANASGKSNLLLGIADLCSLVTCADVDNYNRITERTFQLHSKYRYEPIVFDVTFESGVLYRYRLVLSKERIVTEVLRFFKDTKEYKIFERTWDDEKKEYNYSVDFNYVKELQSCIKETTPKTTFFFAAGQNCELLRPIFELFSTVRCSWDFANNIGNLGKCWLSLSKNYREQLLGCLQDADFNITDIRVMDNNDIFFLYRLFNGNSALFHIMEESAGLRQYFMLLLLVIHSLEHGASDVLLIDGINSLHPLLLIHFLKWFRYLENRKKIQIIFTSHNPLLLDEKILRRDQIWLTDMSAGDRETRLCPLSDYKPYKNGTLVQGYLIGRYGGIPFLTD